MDFRVSRVLNQLLEKFLLCPLMGKIVLLLNVLEPRRNSCVCLCVCVFVCLCGSVCVCIGLYMVKICMQGDILPCRKEVWYGQMKRLGRKCGTSLRLVGICICIVDYGLYRVQIYVQKQIFIYLFCYSLKSICDPMVDTLISYHRVGHF